MWERVLSSSEASAKKGEIKCEPQTCFGNKVRRSKAWPPWGLRLKSGLGSNGLGRALYKRDPRCPLKGIWTSLSAEEVSACLDPHQRVGSQSSRPISSLIFFKRTFVYFVPGKKLKWPQINCKLSPDPNQRSTPAPVIYQVSFSKVIMKEK